MVERPTPIFVQTEIGFLPEDWEIDKIITHSLITTGAKNTQDRIENGKYPFFVRSQTVENINSYSFDGEAVLTAGDGVGTGKVFHYINGKFDFHQRVYKISDFSEKLDGYFFFLYFSQNFYNRIMSMTAKSSVDSVRMDMIADMLIPIPPLKEQLAIATVIRDTNLLIESLERLIEKKNKIFQGLIQEIFTDEFRLNNFKKKWEYKKLEDLCSLIKDGSHNPPARVEEGIPLLSARNVQNGKIIFDDFTYITEKDYNIIHKHYSIKKGDVLITIVGTLGEAAVVNIDKKFTLQRSVAILRFLNEINNMFFYYYTKSNGFKEQIVMNAKTGVQTGLYLGALNKIIVPVPISEEQKSIADLLENIDLEIDELKKLRKKHILIKKGMIQKLLTGRIRLS